MSQKLFANELEALVKGYTNAPLALHEGQISEEALSKIYEAAKPLRSNFLGIPGLKNVTTNLLRIDAERKEVNYITEAAKTHIFRYQFSLDGELIAEEEGHESFSLLDTVATLFTLGIYAAVKYNLPSIKRKRKNHRELYNLYDQLHEANQEDARRVASGVQVYLDPIREGDQINGKTVERIPFSTPKQYVEGLTESAVQIATYLLGGNMVTNYQRASPARGTPMILK